MFIIEIFIVNFILSFAIKTNKIVHKQNGYHYLEVWRTHHVKIIILNIQPFILSLQCN